MTPEMLEARYTAGLAVAHEAGALALGHFRALDALVIERKGLQDLVSGADRAAEDLIRDRLGKAFPDDAFLGEERGGSGEASQLWIIDPIDGTANFLRGMPYWSVAIAFVVNGRTELAFTYDPVHDELFAARRGFGTTRNGQPVRVSNVAEPHEACIGLSFNFKAEPAVFRAAIRGLLARHVDNRRMGSAALSLAHVADGRFDGVLAFLTNSWDVLGGLLLVEEAGGHVTPFVSLLQRQNVVAAAPGLAEALAEIMASASSQNA